MNKNVGLIGAETVKENEDGSADYTFHFDAHARGLLAEEGLKLTLYCAAAGLDLQVVYDFIKDHIRYEKDEYKFGTGDAWKECVSCGGPSKEEFCGFCLEEE